MPYRSAMVRALSSADRHGDSVASETEFALQVRKYGHASASYQTCRGGYCIWWSVDRLGCIPYVDTGGAWVAAGEPLCAFDRCAELAEEFQRAAVEARRRVAFFGVERRWSGNGHWCHQGLGLQPLLDPAVWPQTLRQTRSLREQLRRARACGVIVSKLGNSPTSQISSGIESLVLRWRASKAMPPMGFLVHLPSTPAGTDQHWYIACRRHEVVGIAIVVPLPTRSGWLLEHLLRAPSSPNGTTESLVDAILTDARQRGDQLLTLGLAPLAGELGPVLRWFKKRGAPLYDFEGLTRFKAKFRPQQWDTIGLFYPSSQSAAVSLYDCLCAFAGSGLTRYAIRTVLRGPQIVLRGLALLLVPWVFVLASCDSELWFARDWQRWFWVVFDIAVASSLWALSHRFHGKRAKFLSWLVLFDALTTLGLATFFNLPRIENTLQGLVLALAVAAPWFAWVVLRGSVARGTRP